MSGIIKGLGGWLKNSFIDFPGTVSTVLFFNKCNLICPYCHNPDFINGAKSSEELSEEVWEFLVKRKNVIKGVVLTGGEPTLFRTMVELSENIKDLGFKVKLDTNGLNPDMIIGIAPDYLALDIKSKFEGYNKYLGSSIKDVHDKLIRSIKIVKKMGDCAEVRITAAPHIVNTDTIREISQMINGVNKVFIQKLSYGSHIMNKEFFSGIEDNIDQRELEEFRNILLDSCKYCEIR